MAKELIYLDTYALQQDMRIRLPKSILNNLPVEKGTTNGTITDADGRFTLDIADRAVLIVSYIGYNTQNIPITQKNSYSIKLKEDTKTLDEVVVIGYGSARKKDVTGALTRVDYRKINYS